MDSHEEKTRLRITEIFYSLQGESRCVGLPTLFIRLTGCPLRCQYCDTDYAFQGGEWWDIEQIVERVAEYDTRYVCVTGGEPLAQSHVHLLLKRLCDLGYTVSIETSGALDVSGVDSRVSRVMDIKTPGSGEQKQNRLENITHLTLKDEIKFVICDLNDYQWAKELIIRYELAERTDVLISPVSGRQDPQQLADWVLKDRLPVRFQLQLHKLLWSDERGR